MPAVQAPSMPGRPGLASRIYVNHDRPNALLASIRIRSVGFLPGRVPQWIRSSGAKRLFQFMLQLPQVSEQLQ